MENTGSRSANMMLRCATACPPAPHRRAEEWRIMWPLRVRPPTGACRPPNPWNEFECGSNYARSMAAWSLIPTFSGFEYDMVHGMIGFDPRQPAAGYRTIWSLDSGWGTFAITPDRLVLTVLAGELTLTSIRVPAVRAGAVTAAAVDTQARVGRRAATCRRRTTRRNTGNDSPCQRPCRSFRGKRYHCRRPRTGSDVSVTGTCSISVAGSGTAGTAAAASTFRRGPG